MPSRDIARLGAFVSSARPRPPRTDPPPLDGLVAVRVEELQCTVYAPTAAAAKAEAKKVLALARKRGSFGSLRAAQTAAQTAETNRRRRASRARRKADTASRG